MKTFIILGLIVSASAQAACNTSCAENYRCAEAAFRADQDTDAFVTYSQQHKCQDELKFAALFASPEEETQLVAGKTDLPVIEDARDRAPAQTKNQ